MLLLSLCLALPAQAAGLTDAQISAILGLLSSFGIDQATYQNVDNILHGQGGSGSVASTTASVPCTITRTLSLGLRGDDVSCLQQMLTQTGDYTYGNVTGYFGPATQTAVERYQARAGIVSAGSPDTTGFGAVGSRTRASIFAAASARQGSTTGTTSGGGGGTGMVSLSSSGGGGGGGGGAGAGGGGGGPAPVPPSTPSASIAPGTYAGGQAIVLSASGAASIRYTVDGTAPTCGSGYVFGSNGADFIYLGSTATLKAVACNDAGASGVATFAYTISVAAPNSPCDPGWVLVPGNSRMGTGDFCVMQFQAQNPLGKVSQYATCAATPPTGTETYCSLPQNVLAQQPTSLYSDAATQRYAWNDLTAAQAANACQAAGAKLMDVPHAQTINLNVAEQAQNWQSGTVGQGCLFGGNMDGYHWDAQEPLAAPTGTDATADPYSGEEQDASAIANKVQVCPFLVIQNFQLSTKAGYAGRRTFYLSNGSVIWDWSGNLGEWLSNILPNNPTGVASYFTAPNGNGLGYWDWNSADNPDATYTDWTQPYLADLERPWMGPYDPNVPVLATLNRQNGVGGYYGPSKPGNGAYRGGSYYKGEDAGIFHIDIGHSPTFSDVQVGFRCYKDIGTPPAPKFFSSFVGN